MFANQTQVGVDLKYLFAVTRHIYRHWIKLNQNMYMNTAIIYIKSFTVPVL